MNKDDLKWILKDIGYMKGNPSVFEMTYYVINFGGSMVRTGE